MAGTSPIWLAKVAISVRAISSLSSSSCLSFRSDGETGDGDELIRRTGDVDSAPGSQTSEKCREIRANAADEAGHVCSQWRLDKVPGAGREAQSEDATALPGPPPACLYGLIEADCIKATRKLV